MVNETINPATLWVILTIAGGFIVIILSVLGYFLKVVHRDVKSNTEECGKNKGKIELVQQRQQSDKVHIEEMTQVQLKGLARSMEGLSDNVNTLVSALVSVGVTINLKKDNKG